MCAKFEKKSLKTVGEVDYTNSIPYCARKLSRMTKFKRSQFRQNYFSLYQNLHALLQYVHNMHTRFERDPLKTVGEIDCTSSIPYNVKGCPAVKFRKPSATQNGRSLCVNLVYGVSMHN